MKKTLFIIFVLFLSSCSFITENNKELWKIKESYLASQAWMINNLNDEGAFNYKYFPESKTWTSKNNMIRQLMMSRVLWELSQNNDFFKKYHKKNLEYIFLNWYRESWDYWYVYFSGKSKLGANAMLLRLLIYSPYYETYKNIAYKIANSIEASQKVEWWFKAWYIEPSYEFDEDYLLTFYSWEALLSLIEFYNKTGDEKYLNISKQLADYYIKKYVAEIDSNYYPAYVPWHTMALNKLYKITKDTKYSDAIFILNDRLLEIQNTDITSKYYGRFYNSLFSQYWSPHSSSDSVYTEWLLYALEVAKLEKDSYHTKLYNNSIEKAFDNLLDLQYIEKNNTYLYGSIRYNEEDYNIRVDTTSHFMDAVWKYLDLK